MQNPIKNNNKTDYHRQFQSPSGLCISKLQKECSMTDSPTHKPRRAQIESLITLRRGQIESLITELSGEEETFKHSAWFRCSTTGSPSTMSTHLTGRIYQIRLVRNKRRIKLKFKKLRIPL